MTKLLKQLVSDLEKSRSDCNALPDNEDGVESDSLSDEEPSSCHKKVSFQSNKI